jgi:hypothetical protein
MLTVSDFGCRVSGWVDIEGIFFHRREHEKQRFRRVIGEFVITLRYLCVSHVLCGKLDLKPQTASTLQASGLPANSFLVVAHVSIKNSD